MMRRWIISLGFILACLIPTMALAQGGGIGIIPKQLESEEPRSWFVYTLSSGESISDTVVINNHSSETKFIQIEALDAISTTTGNYSLVDSVEDNQDTGTWMKLDASRIYMPPYSSQEVDFTVAVPENASVGEHNGGIVVYEIIPQSDSGINIKTRVGARLYITVPGEINRQIIFNDVSYKIEGRKLAFDIKAQNDSNVKLEPQLDIILSGLFGHITQTEKDAGTYLAGRSIELTREWERGAPRFGYYKMQFVFHTLSVEQVSADGTKTILPSETFTHTVSIWVGTAYLWWLLAILIFIWLFYRGIVYIGDLRKFRTKFEVYLVGAHENLSKISEKTGIMVPVIVKFNNLKWPHRTHKGEQLLIPRGFLSRAKFAQKTDRMLPLFKYMFTYQKSLYQPVVGDNQDK